MARGWFDEAWLVKKRCPVCGKEITFLENEQEKFEEHVKECESHFWIDKKSEAIDYD